ncbi:LPXTG cell wall anchor domain-containing protein [Staphylococcus agnetis]|nr:LPXTG cell wall anchor domain-containing protein [Staphylococcus agnetis]
MIQDRHQMTPPTTGEQPMMKNHKRTHEMSQKKAQQNDKHMKSMLPETGQTTSTETTTLFGTLLAILGLTAFVTRRKENKN